MSDKLANDVFGNVCSNAKQLYVKERLAAIQKQTDEYRALVALEDEALLESFGLRENSLNELEHCGDERSGDDAAAAAAR